MATSAPPVITSSGASRTSTIDSLDRQLNALGLGAASANDPQAEPPSYTVAIQDGSVLRFAPSEKAAGASEKEAEALAEETLMGRATAFLAATRPAKGSYEALDKPILIPRLNPGPNIPFARAWPPCLEAYDISQHDFLALVDNLNVVCAPHPAARILEIGRAHV